ncbi:MAG: magnesium transporter MgtE N-terminal domain-containing protein [Candidatus Kapaibacterium sp.]
MNLKQILIFALIAVFSLTFIFLAAILGIYTVEPSLLGYKDDTPKDTVRPVVTPEPLPEPPAMVKISESKLKEFRDNTGRMRELSSEKQELLKNIAALQDSLKNEKDISKSRLDSVGRIKSTVDTNIKQIAYLKDSINTINARLQKAENKLKLAQGLVEDQEKLMAAKMDSLETMNFTTFAKMYDNAEPAEVARILEQIDERDAARILKMMQRKKAGKVLEAMRAESAAAILLLGANTE